MVVSPPKPARLDSVAGCIESEAQGLSRSGNLRSRVEGLGRPAKGGHMPDAMPPPVDLPSCPTYENTKPFFAFLHLPDNDDR